MQTRAEDAPGLIKITREIPLPWLIGGVLAIVGQAVLMWAGQRDQAQAIAQLSTQMAEQTKQINALAEKVGVGNLKDLEHDLKLNDLGRRMSEAEAAIKGKR